MLAGTPPLMVEIETTSLRDKTTEVLRNAIITMHFAPGEKLVERRLCEDTGVSRTCVREALRHLEAEGLVSRTPNRGIQVARLSVSDARQIYEMRAIIEMHMARYFVERADPANRKRLNEAFEQIKDRIFADDVLAYAHALDNFADALLEGANNELARNFLRTLGARITFLRVITAKAASNEQKKNTLARLEKLVSAIRANDADAAEAAARGYVEGSARFALEVLSRRDTTNEKTHN